MKSERGGAYCFPVHLPSHQCLAKELRRHSLSLSIFLRHIVFLVPCHQSQRHPIIRFDYLTHLPKISQLHPLSVQGGAATCLALHGLTGSRTNIKMICMTSSLTTTMTKETMDLRATSGDRGTVTYRVL